MTGHVNVNLTFYGELTTARPILWNKTNLVQNLFLVRLYQSLHVSGDYVPIIRRKNCVYATRGTCHSVWMTVWEPCIPDSHPHRITSTKCRINTVLSPDDGHTVARNKRLIIINILTINCAPSWFYFTRLYPYRCARSTEHKTAPPSFNRASFLKHLMEIWSY
jgi:hypothetical protein